MLKRTLVAGAVVFAAAAWSAGPWLPADRELPRRASALLKSDQVEFSIPEAGTVRPAALLRSQSLAGKWKFSGLESSAAPFPAEPDAAELACLAPGFDDAKWELIRVPLNWWLNPSTSYDKVFRAAETTVDRGGSDYRQAANPYFKGIYRHEIELPDPLPSGRIFLNFTNVGYEGRLYVNGKFAGSHHGDFVPWRVDITPFVKPGRNLLALRVLADFGPKDQVATHTYGCMWDKQAVKGGIWNRVALEFDSDPVIERMLLSTDHTGSFRLDYTIRNNTGRRLVVTPGIGVRFAEEKGPEPVIREFPALTLEPGVTSGTLTTRFDNVSAWSPEEPNLYFSMFYLRDGKKIAAARLERFGFRDFKTVGTGFQLNGRPYYLYSESVPSMFCGGWDTADGFHHSQYEKMDGYRKKGYNIFRNPHQPIDPLVLDYADEIGLMVYNEWGFCFLPKIDEKAFEKNNLTELEEFVIRDHNHPAVVMWSLGNEVEHRRDPALTRQLNKQVALVRRLDRQKRPVSAFAGVGNVGNYGKAPLDTDVLDFHLYVGITKPWTRWNSDFDALYRDVVAIYGKDGKLDKPVFFSETVGGGWGLQPDPNYKHGNIDEYLKVINADYNFGNPGAAGYSGVIGVRAALDPQRSWQYTHNYLGTRLVELMRQDSRIAGFAPWIAYPTRMGTRWTQPVYPLLRDNGKNRLMPRQFLVPGKVELEAVVLNQSGPDLKSLQLRIDLDAGKEKPVELAVLDLGPLAGGARVEKRFTLEFPANLPSAGELRLTLLEEGRDVGRNSYPVTLHDRESALKPVDGAAPVALLAPSPQVAAILGELGIPYREVRRGESLESFQAAVIPPGVEPQAVDTPTIREWIENGGRLLMMEQKPGSLPVFPEYQVYGDFNTLVELVTLEHPVFAGLGQADFDIWAENPDGNLITGTLVPLNATALAVKGKFLDSRNAGAGVAEATAGKGRALFSQLDATGLWKKNGAATRYLRNLLAYLAKPESLYAARPLETGRLLEFSIVPGRELFLDLRKVANRNFADDRAGDNKGGWTDQGDNDFRQMPLGRQTMANIPFEIIDPASNDGRSCVVLRGRNTPGAAREVSGIPVNAKIAGICFLHTAGYGGEQGTCAVYRIHYADGRRVDYPMTVPVNVADWWSPGLLKEAVPGIIRTNSLGYQIGCFVARWDNPRPAVEVKSVDFIASQTPRATPILVAATAELAHPQPLIWLDSNNRDQKWGGGSDNGGEPGKVELLQEEIPDAPGRNFARIHFSGNVGNGVPAAIAFLFFDREALKRGDYTTVSFLMRSSSSGRVEITIPEENHRSRLLHSFELQESQGKWIRVRLDLKKDFKFQGEAFPLEKMRTELIFYNGKDRSAGFPRRAVSFDITDLRLE